MKPRAKPQEAISWDTVKCLFEYLERIEYVGKVEFAFQGKPVRVHLQHPMKKRELEKFLSRERLAG